MPSPRRPRLAALAGPVLAGPVLAVTAAQAADDVTYRREAVADAAQVLILDLPVSEEMRYVEGTASYPDHLLFSLDGGHRFAPLHELRKPDAAGLRPATAEDVTTLRWQVPVVPGQRIEVSYRAAAR